MSVNQVGVRVRFFKKCLVTIFIGTIDSSHSYEIKYLLRGNIPFNTRMNNSEIMPRFNTQVYECKYLDPEDVQEDVGSFHDDNDGN